MKRIKSAEQYVFDFKGIEDVRNNFSTYAYAFENHGIVCFRGAFLEIDKGAEVLAAVSKNLNWTPIYKNQDGRIADWRYTQNYDDRANNFVTSEVQQGLINPWHLEGMYKKHTMHAVGWTMRNFKCDSSVGQTGFIDASELVSIMPADMYEFMKKAKLIHYPVFARKVPDPYQPMLDHFAAEIDAMHEKIWSVDGDTEISSNAHDAIQNHPTFGYEVLRLCPCCERWGNQHLLFSVDGEKPTEKDNQFFITIQEWLKEVITDESLTWYHEYEEGDFVIPDLFIMIHSAKGGFAPGEREFDGMWCFQKKVDYDENMAIPIRRESK
jgi:alpha-ketoglutarate-dependent taurine dioxygenase